MDTHFDLFDLPERFELDREALDAAYRAVQTRIHPDRFAAAGPAQQRVAMQWAARANEAYRVLKDPLQRGIYLLQLRGVDVRAETQTDVDPAFLMQQLEWRERIDEARAAGDLASLRALLGELDAERTDRLTRLAKQLDQAAEPRADQRADQQADQQAIDQAASCARELLFIERVDEQARQVADRLEA